MLSFECIKNEKSVYFLLTSALQNQKEGGQALRRIARCPSTFLGMWPHFETLCPQVGA